MHQETKAIIINYTQQTAVWWYNWVTKGCSGNAVPIQT